MQRHELYVREVDATLQITLQIFEWSLLLKAATNSSEKKS
jgi:hypothetical protein